MDYRAFRGRKVVALVRGNRTLSTGVCWYVTVPAPKSGRARLTSREGRKHEDIELDQLKEWIDDGLVQLVDEDPWVVEGMAQHSKGRAA